MNVYERMEAENAYENIERFKLNQKMSYGAKLDHAAFLIGDYLRNTDNCHISVGGLDSITLYMFINFSDHWYMKDIRKMYPERFPIHGISCSFLEDPSITCVHRSLGIELLKPACDKDGKPYNKVRIIQDFGFPVLSKEIASKIETLQNPTEKNKTVRHAIITGETGEYGGYRKSSRMQLAKKWLELFGGYENENESTNYGAPDFKVSSKCCYYLKEKPCDDWAKKHNSYPILGLMASEGGRRAKALMLHGCNYYGTSTIRSCPFAIFNRQDLLHLASEMDELYRSKIKEQLYQEGIEKGRIKSSFKMSDSIVPDIYGEIVLNLIGDLYTTKAQRTGCSMCGFGIHLEQRPHRFDLLRERSPREWDYWMYHCCKDDHGNDFGWAKVLDYIGVEY